MSFFKKGNHHRTLMSLQMADSSSVALSLALRTTRRSSSDSESDDPIRNLKNMIIIICDHIQNIIIIHQTISRTCSLHASFPCQSHQKMILQMIQRKNRSQRRILRRSKSLLLKMSLHLRSLLHCRSHDPRTWMPV